VVKPAAVGVRFSLAVALTYMFLEFHVLSWETSVTHTVTVTKY